MAFGCERLTVADIEQASIGWGKLEFLKAKAQMFGFIQELKGGAEGFTPESLLLARSNLQMLSAVFASRFPGRY